MLDANNVSINIKPEAKAVIDKKKDNKPVLILALDDGSNGYSKKGGTCAIGADYQLVAVDHKDPTFPIAVKNNAGYDLYTSEAELNYLDNGLIINARNTTLSLSDDSGIEDGAVTVNVFKGNQVTSNDMKGNLDC